MEIQKFLPHSSFIPFQAKRLNNANLLYADLDLFHQHNYFKEFSIEDELFYQAVLNEFAYIVPVSDEDYKLVCENEREFLAERYGGIGILSNGGGGRCGLIGPFQLKGIGPTPVVGEGVSFWYSHGGLALQDAVTELVYSHIACAALPYSSSRVLAIIDTGGYILRRAYKNHVNEAEDEHILVRRGLVLRESRIRPAHFARAFYFKPSQYVKDNYPHDQQRVAEAIPLLSELVGNNNPSLSKAQQYQNAIEQIISRAAIQLSYSKVRRIMHGSLTLSNFLIDGGWIDFGSVTVVPAYEQLITASLQPPYWDEFNLFQKTAADICFYVGKFQPEAKIIVGMANDIFQEFVDIYLKQLRMLFVESTGFPIIFSRYLLNNEHYDRLGSILLHIACHENPKSYISDWVLQCLLPTHHWKDNSLRSVLQKLFYAYWIKRESNAPVLPFKPQFVNDLWNSYCALCSSIERIAQAENIRHQSLIQFIGFNMTRQLIGVKQLYRGQLLDVTDKIIENSQSKIELRKNINHLFSEYKALTDLYYSVPLGEDLIIAKNADSISLFWELTLAQYRLEIPEKTALTMCESANIETLSLIINENVLPFTFKNTEHNYKYYLIYFGSVGSDSLHELNNIYIKGNPKIHLLSLFSQNKDLYSAYKSTFDGQTPTVEEPYYSFIVDKNTGQCHV